MKSAPLSRRDRLANLAASCLVMGVQRVWRGVRRAPTADVSLALAMYWTDLKRALREH